MRGELFCLGIAFKHLQPGAGYAPEERSGRGVGEAEPEIICRLVGVVTMLRYRGESVTDQAGFQNRPGLYFN